MMSCSSRGLRDVLFRPYDNISQQSVPTDSPTDWSMLMSSSRMQKSNIWQGDFSHQDEKFQLLLRWFDLQKCAKMIKH